MQMHARASALGIANPEHFIWPASQWGKMDPMKPTKKWDTVWRRLREKAGLPGLRFHDLRHTIMTGLRLNGIKA